MDWVEAHDQRTSRPYWFNRKTKETTWNRPDMLAMPSQSNTSKLSDTNRDVAVDEASYWGELVDSSTGKTYFYHRMTKETRWERPLCLASKTSASSLSTKDSAVGGGSTSQPMASKTALLETMLSAGANAAASPMASSVNSIPASVNSIPTSVRSVQESHDLGDPSLWRRQIDKDTGNEYYYNRLTRQTSWVMPVGFVEQADQQPSGVAAPSFENRKRSLPEADSISDMSGLALSSTSHQPKPSSHAVPVSEFSDNLRQGQPPQQRYASLQQVASVQQRQKVKETHSVVGPEQPRKGIRETQSFISERNLPNMKKILQDSDTEGESSTDAQWPQFAKHRHGWINRILRTGRITNEESLLSFKKSLIKKALLKQNRNLDEQCIQFFKNIMSYMNDRKSGKGDVEHATKILKRSLTGPESIKDEVYLQLCKQVTRHPRRENALKGWELLMLVTGTFPPSKSLSSFLFDFFRKNSSDDSEDRQVAQLAKTCHLRMKKIIKFGVRSSVPSMSEIRAIQQGRDVVVEVYLLNESSRQIYVDSFLQVDGAKNLFSNQLDLNYDKPFALFQVAESGEEQILDGDMRLLDVIGNWEQLAAEHKNVTVSSFRLVFKAELVLKTTHLEIASDLEAIHLLYIQAVHDVVRGRYPAEAKALASLAAIQLQVSFGNYTSSTHNQQWIIGKLDSLVPEAAISPPGKKASKKAEQKRLEMSQKIIAKYSKLSGISQLEAKHSYLDYVQEWPLYGATLFIVEQRQLKEYPNPITIAVTSEAVSLLDPATNGILETFSYKEVVTWGFSEEKFILVIGNLVQQRKFFFRTPKGKFLSKIINDYVQVKTLEMRSTADFSQLE